jgi:LacI family transcriptional regulator
LDVPGDISIIGAGGIEGEHHPSPFLTTINWSRCELGRAAAEMLLLQISGRPRPRIDEVVVPPSLMVRQSTGPPT